MQAAHNTPTLRRLRREERAAMRAVLDLYSQRQPYLGHSGHYLPSGYREAEARWSAAFDALEAEEQRLRHARRNYTAPALLPVVPDGYICGDGWERYEARMDGIERADDNEREFYSQPWPDRGDQDLHKY